MELIEMIIKNETSFLLILFRVSAFLVALPILGGGGVPMSIKVMVSISISVVLFQILKVEAAPLAYGSLTVGIIGEVLIGLVIGLGARLLFAAVELGGTIVGFQMGFGVANVFDPVSNRQVGLIGQVQNLVATLIFLVTNAHHIVLRALVRSFRLIPSFGFYPSEALVGHLMRLAGEMFVLGIKIGIPVIAALLFANIAIGILSRVVPQINALLFSFPVTIGLGLLVIGASLPVFVGLLRKQMVGLEEVVFNLLVGMQNP